MQDRIAAARRNLSDAETQEDWGQAAAARAEIVRLSAEPELIVTDSAVQDAPPSKPTTTQKPVKGED